MWAPSARPKRSPPILRATPASILSRSSTAGEVARPRARHRLRSEPDPRVAANAASYTGQFLKQVFDRQRGAKATKRAAVRRSREAHRSGLSRYGAGAHRDLRCQAILSRSALLLALGHPELPGQLILKLENGDP